MHKLIRNASMVAAALALAGTAAAQISDGRALDRNLRIGSGGINIGRGNFAAEVRFRNAMVTGNAPGGMSFRGDVGYRAPGEFDSALGSDSTFSFRRDSVYSGLAGMGIRGTDALQYQFALTTGSRPPAQLTGSGTYLRAGTPPEAGAGGGLMTSPTIGRVDPTSTVSRADDQGLMLLELRSPAAYITNRAMEPSLMGVFATQEGEQLGMTASPLRGLATQQMPQRPALAEQLVDTSAARRDLSFPLASEQVVKPTDTRAELEPRKPSPYEQLLARLDEMEGPGDTPTREPGKQDPQELGETPEWKRQLDDLRKMLEGEKPLERPDGGTILDPKLMEALRAPESRIKALAAEGFDAYARHMAVGQEHLGAGRYFQAEERFTAALSNKPGDPMASVGRVHAQLGNSLFMSAAVNLRKLLIAHPELIAVKYAPEVLPPKSRTGMIKDRLDALIAEQTGMARDAGLLLAYIGYQSDDEAAVARGFRAMESGEKDADEQISRLAAVMREVWVVRPAAPDEGGLR